MDREEVGYIRLKSNVDLSNDKAEYLFLCVHKSRAGQRLLPEVVIVNKDNYVMVLYANFEEMVLLRRNDCIGRLVEIEASG